LFPNRTSSPIDTDKTPAEAIQESSLANSPKLPPLIVEAEDDKQKGERTRPLSGNRFVDLLYYNQQLLDFAKHGSMDCGIIHMEVQAETRYGHRSCVTIVCSMCNEKRKVWTQQLPDQENDNVFEINRASVVSTLCGGLSLQMYNELLGGLNIPVMSSATYYKIHDQVEDLFNDACLDEMLAAGQEEKAIAEQKGHFVTVKGEKVPCIAVKVDGSWQRRSYKGNYASLLGTVS